MMRNFLAALMIAFSVAAWGQSLSGGFPNPGNPLPTTSSPTLMDRAGSLSVTTSSVAISTMTTAVGSAAWSLPLASGAVSFQNDSASAGSAYVCPKGGTCTVAGSWFEVPPGAIATINIGTSASAAVPSIIGASTATVRVIY